jgi:hypothetical protein
MTRLLQIARVEVELGTLTEDEAAEMLGAGFLSQTDLYRADGTEEWKPLYELKHEPEPKSVFSLKGAQEKLAAAGGAAMSQATLLTQKLKHAATRGKSQLTTSSSRLLESYTPQIEKLVAMQMVKRGVARTQAALRDDEFMRKVFGATYDCVPKPVCRFVTEEAFIKFCMQHRQRLLGLEVTSEKT